MANEWKGRLCKCIVAPILTLLAVAGCRKSDTSYLNSPYLTTGQKALLLNLQAQSKSPIRVKVWAAAGTVNQLQLRVPSGGAPNASPMVQARTFLSANQGLWKLNGTEHLVPGPVVTGNGCTTVTFHLKYPSGQEIYNANLSVGIGPKATVQMVTSRVTGDSFEVAVPEKPVSSEQAKKILREYLVAPGITLPEPTEVIVDPFFMSDHKHAAAKGWLFRAQRGGQLLEASASARLVRNSTDGPGADSYSGPYIVSQQTGQVEVSGPPSQTQIGTGTTATGCPGGESGTLPEVVVDPLSGSPSFVGLIGVPGVSTSGRNVIARAYSVFDSPLIISMYGDLSPREHLLNPIVRSRTDGGSSVHFDEFSNGVPVEGAGLYVNLDSSGAATTIIGRVIYRPMVNRVVEISQPDAVKAALVSYVETECGNDRSCWQSLSQTDAVPISPLTQVILSSRMFNFTTITAGQERLAWKIVFRKRVIYWAANGASQYLFSYPRHFTHIPLQILDGSRADGVEFSNVPTIPVTLTPIDADGAAISGFMPTINSFYATVGRLHSFDNSDATVLCVVTGLTGYAGNAAFLPPQPTVCPGTGTGIFVGPSMGVNDVIGHEFTHAVTFMTAGLINSEESGALNESYSDIMAELIFPDVPATTACPASTATATSWLIGECTAAGAARDMQTPLTHGQPDNVGSEKDMCSDQNKFTHQCDSIPNLAAVRSAVGGIPGDAAAGIGRTKLKFLYYSTLTGGNPPASPAVTGMISSDRFLDQRVTTLNNCWSMVAIGSLSDGTTFTPGDCFHVADSFDSVGVTVAPQYGWTRFGTDLPGISENRVAYAGLHLFNGCTIADITIRGVDGNGTVMTSDIAQGLTINMNGWGAFVASRGSSTDPTDRQVNYHIGASWSHSGTVYIDESYNKPAGITSNEQCENPNPTNQSRTMFSTTLIGHWATFFDGGRNNDPVNVGMTMQTGCTVQSVSGIQYDKGGNPIPPPAATMNNGGSGYTITSTATLPNGLDTNVHTWHDGTSGIFVRVAYNVSQPQGVDCSLAGATQDNE